MLLCGLLLINCTRTRRCFLERGSFLSDCSIGGYLAIVDEFTQTLPPKARSLRTEPSERTRLLAGDSNGITSNATEKPLSYNEILTRPFLITMLNYACLSLLDMSHSALLTLFLAVPIDSGGLGMSPQKIGLVLGAFGLVSGSIQILVFSAAHRRLGAKNMFMIGPTSFALVILPAYIIMHRLAVANGEVTPAVWAVLVVQLAFMCTLDMSFSKYSISLCKVLAADH